MARRETPGCGPGSPNAASATPLRNRKSQVAPNHHGMSTLEGGLDSDSFWSHNTILNREDASTRGPGEA